MGHKEFGALIVNIRKQRSPTRQKWVQKDLAAATDGRLTMAQIKKIEQGKMINLNPAEHIEPLAEALQLTDMEKRQLYSVAGFAYPSVTQSVDTDQVRWLLEEHSFPAYAVTPLWDFVAQNDCADELYGEKAEQTAYLKKAPLGANLLWVLFDKEFNRVELFGGYDRWLDEVTRSIYQFRISTFRHIGTKRYKKILDVMSSTFRSFYDLWDTYSVYQQRDELFPARPTTTIYYRPSHSTHEESPAPLRMTFLSVHVPFEYMGQEVNVSVYVPTLDCEQNYAQMRKRVTINRANFFPLPPFE